VKFGKVWIFDLENTPRILNPAAARPCLAAAISIFAGCFGED
jgi:hypothetical protein